MKTMLKKAVFPVAGMGTRFLPATKANPKEMLPVVDKPLIQYAVEEAITAGCTEMIFVTSSSKRAIEDHFDTNYELEARLEKAQKTELLHLTKNILPKHVKCIYIRQPEPLGLGDAVLQAKTLIGNEPFAVLLADDLILSKHASCLQQMSKVFQMTQSSVLAVEKIPSADTKKYGVVKTDLQSNPYNKIEAIVEKPHPDQAPSNLGVAGRYIFTPNIFSFLETNKQGSGGEMQLTDAISALLSKQPVYALGFSGTRYDCGSKMGYLKATIACALKHPELKQEFQNYLKRCVIEEIYEN